MRSITATDVSSLLHNISTETHVTHWQSFECGNVEWDCHPCDIYMKCPLQVQLVEIMLLLQCSSSSIEGASSLSFLKPTSQAAQWLITLPFQWKLKMADQNLLSMQGTLAERTESGDWIDLYLPTLLLSFSTKACTSRCQATEVSSFPCCLPTLIFLSSRSLQICDFTLQSATDSGKEVTDNANKRFEEANQVLSGYSKRFYPK